MKLIKLFIPFLILFFLTQTKIFGLKIFLKKGIIIPKAKIITEKKIFSPQKNTIEIQAIFGNSLGRTILDKNEIYDIKLEDENAVQPVIIETKNNIIFENPFILERQKKTKLILPYTTIKTDANSTAIIGLDDVPAFKILPSSTIYFDIEIKGLKNVYGVKKGESNDEEEIKESFIIKLLEGAIKGVVNENAFPDGFDIYFPNKMFVKILSEAFYVSYSSEKIIIAVLIGSIVFTDDAGKSITIESGKIAEINFNKEEYIIIDNLEKNQAIKKLIETQN